MNSTIEHGTELLSLSNNEIEILKLVKESVVATPVSLSKGCAIPRPTIYLTLTKLKERGLLRSRKLNNKKIWEPVDPEILEEKIESLRSALIGSKKEYHRMSVTANTDIAIHRGAKTILKLFLKLIDKHGGNRLMGIQGDFAGDAWKGTFKVEDINYINTQVTKEGLLTEIITSKDWFKRQVAIFGKSWAENFLGRAAQVHFINGKYLDYESQIFVFENQLYLVSMKEEIFIEVRNQEISKCIISLLRFIEDNSPSVDVNKVLREIAN